MTTNTKSNQGISIPHRCSMAYSVIMRELGIIKPENLIDIEISEEDQDKEWEYLFSFCKKIRRSISDALRPEIQAQNDICGPISDHCNTALLKIMMDAENDNAKELQTPRVKNHPGIMKRYNFKWMPMEHFLNFNFDFNKQKSGKRLLFDIPEKVTRRSFKIPTGATHFRFFVTATVYPVLNLKKDKLRSTSILSKAGIGAILHVEALTKYVKSNFETMGITFNHSPKPDESLLICQGIEFYKEVEGKMKTQWAWGALKIIDVN